MHTKLKTDICLVKKPCQNGGVCTLLEDQVGYHCDCLIGYSGKYCELG